MICSGSKMPKNRVFLHLVTPPTFEIHYYYKINTKFIFLLITMIFKAVSIDFQISFGHTLLFVDILIFKKHQFSLFFLPNFSQKSSMAVSMATGQQIEKITMGNLFLGDYTQTVKVSSKSVTMRAQSCLVLYREWLLKA